MEATFVSRCPSCFKRFTSDLKPKKCKFCEFQWPEESRDRKSYEGELGSLVGRREPWFD